LVVEGFEVWLDEMDQKLPGIQIARAIAALSVVYFHSWTTLDRFPLFHYGTLKAETIATNRLGFRDLTVPLGVVDISAVVYSTLR